MVTDYSDLDQLIDENAESAYNRCKKMCEAEPKLKRDSEFLWRFGKACMLWANALPKRNPKRKELIFEGREFCLKAYSLNEDSFEALRWTAILCGAATDYLGIKDRVEQGKVFKAYLDKAIGIDPKEYTLLHLRGRFSYEVSNLSWLERKVCNTMFSSLPECTTEEALCDFLEAEKNHNNPWAENLLYVARCYATKKERKLAEEFLRRAEAIENPDDAVTEGINEVRTMVAKLR